VGWLRQYCNVTLAWMTASAAWDTHQTHSRSHHRLEASERQQICVQSVFNMLNAQNLRACMVPVACLYTGIVLQCSLQPPQHMLLYITSLCWLCRSLCIYHT
jgi:hypothetical protein